MNYKLLRDSHGKDGKGDLGFRESLGIILIERC